MISASMVTPTPVIVGVALAVHSEYGRDKGCACGGEGVSVCLNDQALSVHAASCFLGACNCSLTGRNVQADSEECAAGESDITSEGVQFQGLAGTVA